MEQAALGKVQEDRGGGGDGVKCSPGHAAVSLGG